MCVRARDGSSRAAAVGAAYLVCGIIPYLAFGRGECTGISATVIAGQSQFLNCTGTSDNLLVRQASVRARVRVSVTLGWHAIFTAVDVVVVDVVGRVCCLLFVVVC